MEHTETNQQTQREEDSEQTVPQPLTDEYLSLYSIYNNDAP